MNINEKQIDWDALESDQRRNPKGSYEKELQATREALQRDDVVGLSNLYKGDLSDIGLYLAFHDLIELGEATGLSPYDLRVGNHNTMVLFYAGDPVY